MVILGCCWFEIADLLDCFVGFCLRVEAVFPGFCGSD